MLAYFTQSYGEGGTVRIHSLILCVDPLHVFIEICKRQLTTYSIQLYMWLPVVSSLK